MCSNYVSGWGFDGILAFIQAIKNASRLAFWMERKISDLVRA